MTTQPDAGDIVERLKAWIGEFYASDVALDGYTDADMAAFLADRLRATIPTSEEWKPIPMTTRHFSECADAELIAHLRQGAADLHPFCAGENDTLEEFNVALPALLNEAADRLEATTQPSADAGDVTLDIPDPSASVSAWPSQSSTPRTSKMKPPPSPTSKRSCGRMVRSARIAVSASASRA
jgi:hypothetical protein